MIPTNNIGNFSIYYLKGVCHYTENGYVWMDDSEKEKKTHQFAIDECKGKVLVGGLGLGYVVEELAKKEDVKEIVVVEISQENIDLVWKHLDTKGKGKIVKDNLFSYLQTTNEKFDCAYMDIFKDPKDKTCKDKIAQLRSLTEKVVPANKVFMWHIT